MSVKRDPHPLRKRRLRVGALGACLVLSALTGLTPARADGASPTPAVGTTDVSAAQQASAEARATGRPSPVSDATDPYRIVSAQPDGTFTATFSATPQRALKGGSWVPVDTDLRRNADGSLSPVATVNPVTISGGGSGPLYTLHNGDKQLAVSWPTPLPTPEVDGPSAVFHEVLAGVDLVITAGAEGGTSELIVVKTAEAARNAALAQLKFGLDPSSGLAPAKTVAGTLNVVDGTGQVAFQAPAPTMWSAGANELQQGSSESAGMPAARSALPQDATVAAGAPQPDAATAVIATTITSGGDVQLTPDQGMLTDPTTRFPVTIDPAWVPSSSQVSSWTIVNSVSPSSNYVNGKNYSGDPGVGYQGWEAPLTKRETYYQFYIGSTGSTHVNDATLNTTQTEAADFGCTKYPISVDSTNTINDGTTWNSRPTVKAYQEGRQVGGMTSQPSCPTPTIGVPFNVYQAVQSDGQTGDDAPGYVTFRLSGDESDRNGWRRFAKGAILNINYDTHPNTPTAMAASPAPVHATAASGSQGCDSGGGYGWLGKVTGNVTLSASVSDPDGNAQNVNAEFAVTDGGVPGGTSTTLLPMGGSGSPGNSVPGTGGTSSIALAANRLTDGHLYGWWVRAFDGIDYGPQAAGCHFWLDSTAPTAPNATTPNGVQPVGKGTVVHLAGATDTSSVAGGAVSGIDYYTYSTSGDGSDLTGGLGTQLAPGTADFTIQGNAWGPNTIWYAAVDRAGNISAPRSFTFFVPDDLSASVYPGDIDGLTDAGGLKHPDLLVVNTGSLQLYNITQCACRSGSGAATDIDAPNGTSWDNTLIAHRGSNTGNRIDDLWAQHKGDANLYLYINQSTQHAFDPSVNKYYATANNGRVTVTRPLCTTGDCAGYNADWSHATQLIAPGDLDGDGAPDVLTFEGNTLWLFHGTTTSGLLASPQKIDSWGNATVLAPGDTTGDSIPDIWIRYNDTGNIYQFTTTRTTDGTTGTTTVGLTGQTRIGELDPVTFPLVTTVGDINGGTPAHADLFATSTNGNLYYWLGQTPPSGDYHAFGSQVLRGTGGWNNVTNLNGTTMP